MRSSLVRKLRQLLLPPDSRQELFLRTLYHRLNAKPFFTNRQMRKAKASYHRWKLSQSVTTVTMEPGSNPRVCFLLEIPAGNEVSALETIQSLQAMAVASWSILPILGIGVNWDVLIHQVGEEERILDPIPLGDFSVDAIKKDNEYVVFCQAGDLFHPSLLTEFFIAHAELPSASVIYTDCEYKLPGSEKSAPFFKPSALSPELMVSVNYLSRSFVRISSLVELPTNLPDLLSLEYDLHLRLMAQKAILQHIPRVLVSLRQLLSISDQARQALLSEHFQRRGYHSVDVQVSAGLAMVNWDFGSPTVSLILLNRDHGAWLRSLVDSILALTDYPQYSLIIVDNNSSELNALNYFEELKDNPRVEVIHYDTDFNYSEAINIGVARSTADVIVLLNNDMLVTDSGWLRELVQWAVQPEIGVVGGKLLHRNGSVQHAGIILGMNGIIGHLYLNAPEHYHGLAGSVDWYRNFYAVTGACQAIRRDLFHQVGGYDVKFQLAFGDIDFCLRVVKAGYRNLYNPFCSLIHFEGGSRGYETPVRDILLGYDELEPWLDKDDPYFSPNLTYEPIPRCNSQPEGVNTRLANIHHRKQAFKAGYSGKDDAG